MIDISTLSALLSFSDAELLRDMVGSVIASPHIIGFLRKKPGLEDKVRAQLSEWQRGLSSQIGHQPVPDALEQEFRERLVAAGEFQTAHGYPRDEPGQANLALARRKTADVEKELKL